MNTTDEFEAAVQRFHELLADVCTGNPDDENCEKCWLRLYCFTGPRSVTHELVHEVVKTLESDDKDKNPELYVHSFVVDPGGLCAGRNAPPLCPAGARGARGPFGGTEEQILDRIVAELQKALKRNEMTDGDGNIFVLTDWWTIQRAKSLLCNYRQRLEADKAASEAGNEMHCCSFDPKKLADGLLQGIRQGLAATVEQSDKPGDIT